MTKRNSLKSIISFFTCSTVFIFSTAATAHGYFNIKMGLGGTTVGETNAVTLFNTPSPGITNTYQANRSTELATLFGVGAGYRFPVNRFKLGLGLEASYLDFGSAEGTVHPLTNIAPDFDTLSYSYDAQSYLLMVTPSIEMKSACSWNPFFTLGLGVAYNRLSNYTETTNPGSTASPSLFPFRTRTQSHFAYAPAIGFEHKINGCQTLQIGYQYVNAGDAELGTKVNQQTGEHLKAGTLSAHLFMINLLLA